MAKETYAYQVLILLYPSRYTFCRNKQQGFYFSFLVFYWSIKTNKNIQVIVLHNKLKRMMYLDTCCVLSTKRRNLTFTENFYFQRSLSSTLSKSQLFERAHYSTTGFKLKEGRFRLGIKAKLFTVRVVRCWNRLLSLWILWRCSRPGWMGPDQPGLVLNVVVGGPAMRLRGGWSLMILEVPSNPSHFVIL